MFIKYLSSSYIRSDHFLFFFRNLHSLLSMSISSSYHLQHAVISLISIHDLLSKYLTMKSEKRKVSHIGSNHWTSQLLIFYWIYPTCFLLLPIFQSRMWNLYSPLQIVCLTSLTSPISVVQMSIQMSFIFPPLNQHKNQTFLWSICWRVRYRHLFTDIFYFINYYNKSAFSMSRIPLYSITRKVQWLMSR